jgi:hypothetical protein
MSEAWDAWLAECLSAMGIDADVFGPYVTGIMVRGGPAAREAHIGTFASHAGPGSPGLARAKTAFADSSGRHAGGRDAAGG